MSDLWQRLYAAFHNGDQQTFIGLCQGNTEHVLRVFDDWAVAPVEIRHDPQAVNDYLRPLLAVAQVMEALGHPGPLHRLSPPGAESPFNRWMYAYQRAQQLSDAGEHTASTAELRTLLEDMRGATGTGVDEILAKVAGLLGTNALRLGQIDDALAHTGEALQRCRAMDDLEGVWIYTENLDTLTVAKEIAGGTPAGRELTDTRDRLAFAQDLSDARRYSASNEVLHELLGTVIGTAGARYLGKIHGLLGLNHFRLGDRAEALRRTELALAECRARQDYAGERIYTANIAELRR
ncbi:hypothetical protein LFM09_28935 [Lentzea alba]|uniref:hypothetical protein n=1 Tax=Lentzea alba TaxID=2714351 RepID=UPI0039BF211D